MPEQLIMALYKTNLCSVSRQAGVERVCMARHARSARNHGTNQEVVVVVNLV